MSNHCNSVVVQHAVHMYASPDLPFSSLTLCIGKGDVPQLAQATYDQSDVFQLAVLLAVPLRVTVRCLSQDDSMTLLCTAHEHNRE